MDKYHELRKRAQKIINSNTQEEKNFSQDEIRKLVHELETYQVELELQNDVNSRIIIFSIPSSFSSGNSLKSDKIPHYFCA